MKRHFLMTVALTSFVCISAQVKQGNDLPVKLEELTSPAFVRAVGLSKGVCIIPLGIIEKHGPHLPLGTDLFEARETATQAALKEYAVVFPPYYTGQIFEARHQPGTIAYGTDLIWRMLEETCRELARNGLNKIILFNGHGGNTQFLTYFCQAQLASRKDYLVVLFQGSADPKVDREIEAMKKASLDGHAGEEESSMMYFIRPDLIDREAAMDQSGEDQKRLAGMKNGYTGIWWYARYPNHFASDTVVFNKKLGELLIKKDADQLAGLIKYLKESDTIEKLQDEFYERAIDPLKK